MYGSADQRILEVFRELERVSLTTISFIKEEHAKHPQDVEATHSDQFVITPDAEYLLGSARERMHADYVAYLPVINSQEESEYWIQYTKENIGWIGEATEVYTSQKEHGAHQHTSTRTLVEGNWSNVDYEADQDDGRDEHMSSQNAVDPDSVTVHYEIWRYQVYDESGLAVDYDTLACPMWSMDGDKSGSKGKEALKTEEAIDADRIFPYFPEPSVASGLTLAPIWTSSPPYFPGKPRIINFNAMSDPTFHYSTQVVRESRKTTFADVCSPTAPWIDREMFPAERYAIVTTPLFEDMTGLNDADKPIIGYYMALVPWTVFFSDTIGDGRLPVTVTVANDCGRSFTMLVEKGKVAKILNQSSDGESEREDFNDMKLELPLAPFAYPERGARSSCSYKVSIYPTDKMEAAYKTNEPIIYASVVLVCFLFASFAFILFDCVQQRRQRHLVNTARRQNLIVSALFPKKIQNQLLEEMKENEAQKFGSKNHNKSGTAGLRQFLEREHKPKNIGDAASWGSLDGKEGQGSNKKAKPIADLFPETTIMFADIVGFTAWASEREPTQVFILLESIYREFDRIAKRKKVFKVEVVGDCYVAVCGLPDKRKKHAVVMAKFAADCLAVMSLTVKKLEMDLGPDTSDLKLKVGLHSGPVVAGVLRGDRSRFQLFGDTVCPFWCIFYEV